MRSNNTSRRRKFKKFMKCRSECHELGANRGIAAARGSHTSSCFTPDSNTPYQTGLPEEDGHFVVCEITEGMIKLQSGSKSVTIDVNPLMFIQVDKRHAIIGEFSARGSRHLCLSMRSASKRDSIEKQIRLSYIKYFPHKDFANFPRFMQCGSKHPGHHILLAGFCLYQPEETHCPCRDLQPRYVEMDVPHDHRRLPMDPCRLALYTDATKSELQEVLVVGCPRNRTTITKGQANSVLFVENSLLCFRDKAEAELWYVAMNDVLSSMDSRWRDLTTHNPPRGYRSHLEALRKSLEEDLTNLQVTTAPTQTEDVVPQAIRCIEYMERELEKAGIRFDCDLIKSTLSLLSEKLVYIPIPDCP